MDFNYEDLRRPGIREQIPQRGVMDIVATSFGIYGRQFLVFFLLSAAAIIPITLVTQLFSGRLTTQLQSQYAAAGVDPTILNAVNSGDSRAASQLLTQMSKLQSSNPQFFNQLFPSISAFIVALLALGIIGGLLHSVIVNSTLTYMAADQGMGRTAQAGRAFGQASNRWMTLTLGWIAFFVMIILLFVVPLVIFTLLLLIGADSTRATSAVGVLSLVFLLLFLLLLVFILYMSVTIGVFLTPVATLENVGPMAAIGRAYRLGKANFWRIIGFQFVLTFLTFLFGVVIGLFIGLLIPTTPGIGTTLISALITSLLSPLSVIGATLLYIDARVRYDNLNEDLSYRGEAETTLSELPYRQMTGALVGGRDILNMLLLFGVPIIIGVVLIFALAALGQAVGSQYNSLPGFQTPTSLLTSGALFRL